MNKLFVHLLAAVLDLGFRGQYHITKALPLDRLDSLPVHGDLP